MLSQKVKMLNFQDLPLIDQDANHALKAASPFP